MASRKKVKKNSPNVEVRYSNWLAQVCNMIMARFVYLILGRGSSKTTEFQVERLIEMCYDMPGAPVCWVSDTYANLQKNVLPSVLEGLARKGFIEGTHYVVEKAPLDYKPRELEDLPAWLREHFWKPYNQLASYKHTIIFFTGLNIRFGSLDRPASLAGPSYVHVFGDEAKYFREDRINNLLKAVRGYREKYSHSVFYRGHTFTTDMPDTTRIGEYDWILKRGAEMDPEAIITALKAAMVLNEAAQELVVAKEEGDTREITLKQRTYERWIERWTLARLNEKAHRFFFIASSYINVAYLSLEWFADAIKDQVSDLKTAIFGCKPSLSSGDRFYAALTEQHFYKDGSNPAMHDEFSLTAEEDCRILKYLNRKKLLEAGADFGNMISLTMGQPAGKRSYRVLKFMYVLTPQSYEAMGEQFRRYFQPMEVKVLHLYFDRAGNNYQERKEDHAGKLKEAIEKKDGKPTGWRVVLMSRNQGNIGINEEYHFMLELFGESNPKLPRILFDYYHCKELRLSLQNAPTKKNTRDQIVKDKRSENLPTDRLPTESTNPSDSWKYLAMRKPWRKLIKALLRKSLSTGTTH